MRKLTLSESRNSRATAMVREEARPSRRRSGSGGRGQCRRHRGAGVEAVEQSEQVRPSRSGRGDVQQAGGWESEDSREMKSTLI